MGENFENQNTPKEDVKDSSLEEASLNMPENSFSATIKHKNKFFVNGGFYNFMLVFGIVFLISLYFFQIFMSPIKVVGKSMQPTINISVLSDSDEEHCDVVYYKKNNSYTNDDIVIVSNESDIFVSSPDPKTPVNFLIKRIIAKPGDSITFYVTDIVNGCYYYKVIVKDKNGNQIDIEDDYIVEDMKFTYNEYLGYFEESKKPNFRYKTYLSILSTLAKSTSENYTSYTIKISNDEFFVMGDNRNHSEDSRYFGAVPIKYISGKVVLQVPYGSNIWQALWLKLKEQL